MTHALRHTFASHFMMNGGNILTLQKILGHSTLAMTIRYAHLAPDHLQEAKSLNSLVHTKQKYKLVDLIAETTGSLPRVDGWDAMKPVGQEIL